MSDLPYALKNMKELNTEGGVAFTAQLYHGKKKIGTLENTGTGGADVLQVWVVGTGWVRRSGPALGRQPPERPVHSKA